MNLPKIPTDIFKNRCQFCRHYISGKENREIKSNEVYRNKDNPCVCRIQTIAQYKYQEHDKEYRNYWYVPYKDGECRSFTPNFGYPICEYCEYSNPFKSDSEYCTKNPKNRKVAVMGNLYGDEYGKYAYMICDKWEMDNIWREKAKEMVAEGKIPKCFNPDTYKLLKPSQKNEVAEKWRMIIDRHKEEKAKLQKEKEEAKKTDKNGQYKIF